MAKYIINTDYHPLVLVTYPPVLILSEFDAYISQLRPVYQRGKLALLADLRAGNPVRYSANDRKHLASAVDGLTLEFPNAVVAEAVVTSSAVFRGVFTAYNWLKKDRSYQSKCFTSTAVAVDWATEQLAEAGLQVKGPVIWE